MFKIEKFQSALLLFILSNLFVNVIARGLKPVYVDNELSNLFYFSISALLLLVLLATSIMLWKKILLLKDRLVIFAKIGFFLFIVSCLFTTIMYGMFSPFSYLAFTIVGV